MSIISAEHIVREFRSTKKESGFKGTIKLLFKPERVVHTALKDINFSISSGEFVGLIGANGAGKTTLLKVLSGLIPQTQGKVKVLGESPFDRSMNFRKKIALVMGQKAQLWWDLPANEAFELLRAIYQIPKDDFKTRVDQLTRLLSVEKLLGTQIRRLSLGERMKMEIIGSLIHNPQILFLDEPTIGLDVLASKKLRDFLREHNKKFGTTIILTSHNMDDITELCERILILKEGTLIFDGKPESLVAKDESQLRVQFQDEASIDLLRAELSVLGIHIEKDSENEATALIVTPRNQISMLIQKIVSHHSVLDIGIQEPSLERVIQKIYQESSS